MGRTRQHNSRHAGTFYFPICLNKKICVKNLVKIKNGSRSTENSISAKGCRKSCQAQKNARSNAKGFKKCSSRWFESFLYVCKAQMPDPKTYKQHFENKHSKLPLPAELKDI